MFNVLSINGIISIRYLSTYENAGKVEVWVSRSNDFRSSGGFRSYRRSSDSEGILLLHVKKQPDYAEAYHNKSESYKFGGYMSLGHSKDNRVMDCFTHSGYIDSYDTAARISEIKEATFRFAASGSLFVHVRHLQLPNEELIKRKGDKFKLIAIRVC